MLIENYYERHCAYYPVTYRQTYTCVMCISKTFANSWRNLDKVNESSNRIIDNLFRGWHAICKFLTICTLFSVIQPHKFESRYTPRVNIWNSLFESVRLFSTLFHLINDMKECDEEPGTLKKRVSDVHSGNGINHDFKAIYQRYTCKVVVAEFTTAH